MNRPNITAAALDYLDRGWSFYPTRPRSKEPYSELLPLVENAKGYKSPAWSPFQQQKPTHADVRTWFDIAPNANLAIITGQISGLVILDCDSRDGEKALVQFCGDLPETPKVRSSRGVHFYFAHPMNREVRGSLDIDDVDLKGDGGCCTAAPSVHQTGRIYDWYILPTEAPLAPLPDAILEHLDAKARAKAAPFVAPTGIVTQSGHPYARTSLQNAVAEIAATRKSRHNKIRGVTYGIGRLVGSGALDLATACNALLGAAAQTGFPQREAERVIDDSLRAGMSEPRWIEDRPAPARAPKRALPSLGDLRANR